MKKEFIINLQGKDFVKFEWLLNEFHENGWKSITTEILNLEPFIVRATATWEKWTYTWMGDANDDNVNRMISKHKIRMAETRAIARALRWYNNIWMCSADEMGGNDSSPIKETKIKPAWGDYTCTRCSHINREVKLLSSKYGDWSYFFCSECKKSSPASAPIFEWEDLSKMPF